MICFFLFKWKGLAQWLKRWVNGMLRVIYLSKNCDQVWLRAKGLPSLLFHVNQAGINSLAFSSTSVEAWDSRYQKDGTHINTFKNNNNNPPPSSLDHQPGASQALSVQDLPTQRNIHRSAKYLQGAGAVPSVWRRMMILSGQDRRWSRWWRWRRTGKWVELFSHTEFLVCQVGDIWEVDDG